MNRFKQQHETYKKQLRNHQWRIFWLQLFILIGLLLLWELASRFYWIDPLLFSRPTIVLSLFVEKLADLTILPHIGVTLFETVCSFLIGTLMGVGIATLLVLYEPIAEVTKPFLTILNALPKVAIGPIVLVVFGPTLFAVMMMGVLITFIISALVVYNAFCQVDSAYVKLMRVFHATKWQTYRHVLLPATVPTIMSTLKVNIGLAWVGVIVGEFLVAKKGLGYLIITGFQIFQFDLVYLSICLILILASVMYFILEGLEKKWAK